MDRWQKVALSVLTGSILLLGTFSVGFSVGRTGSIDLVGGSGEASDGIDVIQDAFDTIRSQSVDPPSEQRLARGAVRGMVDILKKSDDPYALFYTPHGYRSFQELTTGRFSGIGVWLKEKNDRLEIISVIPSSPALEAGLERGDVIRSIDGDPVHEMSIDEAVNRIKGPEGSQVGLGISRDGRPVTFRITRESLELPNVIARRTADGSLGYIRLFGFARGAGRQTHKEVKRLTAGGADGIVLDLRDNGGGLFAEAIDVASVFIEGGKIVTFQDRSDDDVVYEAKGDAFEKVPLVVLVNEGTASASEIVAGALKDRDRAVLVGSTTYGKGSVQEVVPLLDSSALKLTTGAYVTPSGDKINEVGIKPDVAVDAEPIVQRRRAVEILKGIILSVSGAQS